MIRPCPDCATAMPLTGIGSAHWVDGQLVQAVTFTCPRCHEDHPVVVPAEPRSGHVVYAPELVFGDPA